MSLLKKFFGWFANRWVLSVLGLLIVALLIWLFGPEVAFAGYVPLASEVSRLLAILVVVSIWSAIAIVKALRQRRTNQAMIDDLMPKAAPPAEEPSAILSREEAQKLELRFRDALGTLRTMRLGGKRDRRYLYQLPWYVIIGPPGSGKTTALAHSGLKFPLSEKIDGLAVRGVGGTRNCDWFFTDEAVLIDTAGRYTTQDSEEAVDRSAWQNFLQLLRRYRARRSIEGVLVAFSIADLATSDSSQRLAHARAIKRRVQEVHDVLKLRAPVYVLFTKCDLIAGFNDFFYDLSAEERAQVWGTTFSVAESNDVPALLRAFPQEFDHLVERLSARVITRLEEESDIARRALLLSFPQQFALMRPALDEFLSEAFGQSRFEEPLFLRGVYFTSATQEGTPIDRVIGAVARAFHMQPRAMPAFSGRGASFFLTRLLREVVFPESGLALSTSFFARHRAYALWALYSGALALTTLAIAGLSVSYLSNRTLVTDVGTKVDTVAEKHGPVLAGAGDVMAILRALDALRDLPGGYAERDNSVPLNQTLGLYQGDKLGQAALDSYRRALDQLFIPLLMRRLEQQAAENTKNTDVAFQALKAYLMFTTPDRRDVDFMKLWIAGDWSARYPGADNAGFRERFNGHLQALFETPIEPTPEPNTDFVARTRRALLSLPPAARVYSELKGAAVTPQSAEWTLANHAAAKDFAFFRRRSGKPMNGGVPVFYTVDGYRKYFITERSAMIEAAGRDTWVLGPEFTRFQIGESGVEIVRKAEELYLSDYIREWDALLTDLELAMPANVEQLADILRAVSQPDSPVKNVLKPIAEQTQLAAALRKEERERQVPTGRLETIKGQIRDIIAPAQAAKPDLDPAERVDAHFRPLAELLGGGGTGPAPIDAALRPLGELYSFILQTRQSGGDPRGALDVVRTEVPRARALAAQLQSQAKAQPEPMRRWLTEMAGTVNASAVAPRRPRPGDGSATSGAPLSRPAASKPSMAASRSFRTAPSMPTSAISHGCWGRAA
ncbi:MAG: type VI secretion system membrane subunit TssM [Rhodospirillales bacterium]